MSQLFGDLEFIEARRSAFGMGQAVRAAPIMPATITTPDPANWSIRSKNGLRSSSKPADVKFSAEGIPNTVTTTTPMAAAVHLGIRNSSRIGPNTTANPQVHDVNADRNNRLKNTMLIALPAARSPNTAGNAVNESWLPVSGTMPKVNTIGKTISPARIETKELVATMAAEDAMMLTPLGV